MAGITQGVGNRGARVAFAAPLVSATVAGGVPAAAASIESHSAKAALAAPVLATPAAAVTVTAVPAGAGSIGQQITVAVNTAFNTLFTGLGGLPGSPISGLLEGALVLVRRTVFGLVPTGVTAAVNGSTLVINVDPGSTAYFRQNGTSLQVSGDPVFFHILNAKQFDATSIQTVTATGTGNAGLVFSAGAVNASLETTGIDSLNFGAGAQFEGSVNVDAKDSATLVLYNAVRGKSGVTLDAPAIRLATNVDVEAASLTGTAPDVTFTGTVDATTHGAQSLSVTALGTTTFEEAVGSQAALGSLLTRGIAPLNIPQSGDSQTMPLYYMPEYSASQPGGVKTGIPVAIGNNAPQFYTFDAGGSGFVAGYSPNFWQGVSLIGPPARAGYGNGSVYLNGIAVTSPITIGEPGNSVTTGPIALLAGLDNSPAGYTNPDSGPWDGRFFGDFGVSFAYNTSAPSAPLTSALWQLPGGLSNGFLVQLGPIGTHGQLTLGAPQALTDQFPYAITVPPDPSEPNYPVSGYPALAKGVKATYQVSKGGAPKVLYGGQPVPTILDTGNASTFVEGQPADEQWFKESNSTQIEPGTTFTATFTNALPGKPNLVWSFVTGNQPSVNQVNYQEQKTGAYPKEVNAGLNIYNQFDALFDAQKGLLYLRPNGGQSTVILDSSVNTAGAQSYQQGNVTLNGGHGTTTGTYSTGGGAFSVDGVTTLGGDTAINAGSGAVRFSGTVDSGTVKGDPKTDFRSLTVNTTGLTTFVRAVGWFRQLLSLTTIGGGAISTASVTTEGSQAYSGDVSLNGPYWVYDAGSALTVAGSATLAGPTSINTCGNRYGADGRDDAVGCGGRGINVSFAGAIDSLANKGFTLTLAAGNNGIIAFNGAVGGTNPLGGLVIDSAQSVTAFGAVSLDGTLGYSSGEGLEIGSTGNGSRVGTANFTFGGSIVGFQTNGGTPNGTCGDQRVGACGSGVVVTGTPSGSIEGFTIANNASYGIYSTNSPLSLTQTNNNFIGNAGPDVGPLNGQ